MFTIRAVLCKTSRAEIHVNFRPRQYLDVNFGGILHVKFFTSYGNPKSEALGSVRNQKQNHQNPNLHLACLLFSPLFFWRNGRHGKVWHHKKGRL
jgi:hypothetical protein